MRNKLVGWEISGFVFVIIFGTILHFIYDWSENNCIVGLFSSVNESTWEHLKLLFVPTLLYSIVEYFIVGKDYPNFIVAKSFGILLGLFAIITSFYTYTGIIGKHFLLGDILTFIIGVAITFLYSWWALNKVNTGSIKQILGLILIITLAVCFVVFTFRPPHIPLFLDPVSKEYGVCSKVSPL